MAKENYKSFKELAQQSAMYPKEAPLKVSEGNNSLTIGVPKEMELGENRICLTPESVGLLVSNGHNIVIESGAGTASKYSDRLYSDKGARIVYSSKEAYEADIVLKVEPPTIEEIQYIKPGTTLLSALQLAHLKKEYLEELNKKKITGIAFEFIEDKAGTRPVVRSMSEIAAACIVNLSGEYLSKATNGMGVVFGGVAGVPPAKIVILGAGTIAEHVARVAQSLGAEVRIFDNHHYKLRRLQKSIGQCVYTSIIDAHTLSHELPTADVVIGALRSDEGMSPCVVTEEMVMNMKEGAVIIDASISQGGCFETSRLTTHSSPTFEKYGVIHYCVPNIPSRVCKTATRALSYIFTPIILHISRMGGVEEMIYHKDWFMKGVYSYKGYLTNQGLSKRFGLDCKDLRLLLAARF